MSPPRPVRGHYAKNRDDWACPNLDLFLVPTLVFSAGLQSRTARRAPARPLFLGFGLFNRYNLTVAVALAVGALSMSGAICLLLELSSPYSDLLRISDTPLGDVLRLIAR